MDEVRTGLLQVSGVDIELAGREDDLYFRNALADGFVYEPAVAAADLLLPEQPVVLDVGASIGAVTAAIATLRPAAHIVSFEANPDVHPSLAATTQQLDATVTMVDRAVGAQAGTLSFHRDPNGSAWGFLSDELGETEVPVVTVDATVAELGLDRVDFIKIDVEGGELAVLEGAAQTLESHRPTVVFEVNVFCLWRYGRTLPQDLFAWVMERLPNLTAMHPDGTVTRIEGPATVNHLLFQLGTRGGLLDVVASWESLEGLTDETVAPFAQQRVEPPAATETPSNQPTPTKRRFFRR